MLSQLLKESWVFFRRHLVALSMIILPIVVPVDILTAWYLYSAADTPPTATEQFVLFAIGFGVYPIYAAGIVFYIDSVISGQPINTETAWRLGLRYWYPYFALGILVGIAIFIGFLALILPGVILLIRFSFSEFNLLLDARRPTDAMTTSWNQTRHYVWVLIGGFGIITAAFYLPYYFIAPLFDEGTPMYWFVDIATDLIYAVAGSLYTIFAFRIYDLSRKLPREEASSETTLP